MVGKMVFGVFFMKIMVLTFFKKKIIIFDEIFFQFVQKNDVFDVAKKNKYRFSIWIVLTVFIRYNIHSESIRYIEYIEIEKSNIFIYSIEYLVVTLP